MSYCQEETVLKTLLGGKGWAGLHRPKRGLKNHLLTDLFQKIREKGFPGRSSKPKKGHVEGAYYIKVKEKRPTTQ